MITTTLYLTEPGTSVHKVDERLVLRRERRVVGDVPMINLRQVVIIGRGIEISTEAQLALVARNIDLSFFSRNLSFLARVQGDLSNFGQLRFLQARYVDNLERQLTLAKSIVRGKLQNQIQVLARSERGTGSKIEQVSRNLTAASDLDSLRGYEGQGAALYFEGLRRSVPLLREMEFHRREYFPPPDPVNALLSFAYTMLTHETLAAVHLVGFDPYLGFFHAVNFGRPSLALDIVEEFRPVMDQLILSLLVGKEILPGDFEQLRTSPETTLDQPTPQPAIASTWRLKPVARNRFLEHYERLMAQPIIYERDSKLHPLRRIIELQVRQIREIVLGETTAYYPVIIRTVEIR